MSEASYYAAQLIGTFCVVSDIHSDKWFGRVHEMRHGGVFLADATRIIGWQPARDDNGQHDCNDTSLMSVATKKADTTLTHLSRPVSLVWLRANEIMPCINKVIESLVASIEEGDMNNSGFM